MKDEIVIDGITYIRKGLDTANFSLRYHGGKSLYLEYKGKCILRLDAGDPSLEIFISQWFDVSYKEDLSGLQITCKGIEA